MTRWGPRGGFLPNAKSGAAAVLLCAASAASAARAPQPVEARIAVDGAVHIQGRLAFDLEGGPAHGEVEIAGFRFGESSPLRLQGGGGAVAEMGASARFTGTYPGGASGAIQGTVEIEGQFRRLDDGCTGTLRGSGTWEAQVSGLLGIVRIEAQWPALQYTGCDALPADRFWLVLPPMEFVGLMNGRMGSHSAATLTMPTTGTPPPPTETPTPTLDGDESDGLGLLLLLVVAAGAGILMARGRGLRSAPPPPDDDLSNIP